MCINNPNCNCHKYSTPQYCNPCSNNGCTNGYTALACTNYSGIDLECGDLLITEADSGNEVIQKLFYKICDITSNDELVKISSTDTTAGHLIDKVEGGDYISITTINSHLNEKIKIDLKLNLLSDLILSRVPIDKFVKISSSDTTPGYLRNKLSILDNGLTLATLNTGVNESLALGVKISNSTGNTLIFDGSGLYVPTPITFEETVLTTSDTSTIRIIQSGASGHTFNASVKLSQVTGNTIIDDGTGLFMGAQDSSTIEYSLVGSNTTKRLTGKVKISTQTGNSLIDDGGLFVPISNGKTYNSTPTITLSDINNVVTANARISTTGGNALVNNNGLYVPSFVETSFVANSSDTINFNTGGPSSHTLTADVKISTIPGNNLVNNGGLYVPLVVNNGLSKSGDTIQLGGKILHDTRINTDIYRFIVSSDASSTSIAETVMEIQRNTSGNAAQNGIGASLDFGIETSLGIATVSNRITSIWTDVNDATRTAEFQFWGVNNGFFINLLNLPATGQLVLPQYVSPTSFTGTAIAGLGYDSTGKVIAIPLVTSGGGGGTESDPIFIASPAYGITSPQIGHWEQAYADRIVGASVTGSSSKILTLTKGSGATLTAPFTDSSSGGLSSVTADNGLSSNTSSNTQLGGALTKNTAIDVNTHTFSITGTASVPMTMIQNVTSSGNTGGLSLFVSERINWSGVTQANSYGYNALATFLDYHTSGDLTVLSTTIHSTAANLLRLNSSGTSGIANIVVNQVSSNGRRGISANAVYVQVDDMPVGSTVNYSDIAAMQIYAPSASSGTGTTSLPTITNSYGLLIGDQGEYTNIANIITNRYSIYQSGPTDRNYFSGGLEVNNNIEILSSSRAIILRSPNNSRWRIVVDNSGAISATPA